MRRSSTQKIGTGFDPYIPYKMKIQDLVCISLRIHCQPRWRLMIPDTFRSEVGLGGWVGGVGGWGLRVGGLDRQVPQPGKLFRLVCACDVRWQGVVRSGEKSGSRRFPFSFFGRVCVPVSLRPPPAHIPKPPIQLELTLSVVTRRLQIFSPFRSSHICQMLADAYA